MQGTSYKLLIMKLYKVESHGQELIEKFIKPIDEWHKYPMCLSTALQSALLCVDEMLKHGNLLIHPFEHYSKKEEHWQVHWKELKKYLLNYDTTNYVKSKN